MATLEDRLREVMAAKGWEAGDLKRVSKQSWSLVSQWLSGGVKSIGKMDSVLAIEAESGYSAMWIAKGLGPKMAIEAKQADTPLAGAVASVARAVADASKIQRRQLAALLESLASAPEDRADTCAAIMGLLAPGTPYVYTETWEESARRLAVEVAAQQVAIAPDAFIRFVDEARGLGEGGKLAPVPQQKAA